MSTCPQMTVTFDDQFLLTSSEDGCLLMWKIIDKDGRGPMSNTQVVHTEEVLVTKSDLEEKVCEHSNQFTDLRVVKISSTANQSTALQIFVESLVH